GLARGPERGADFLGLLHRDQAIDDIAALHQQVVDLLIDTVDLLAQLLQGGWCGGGFSHACNSSGRVKGDGRYLDSDVRIRGSREAGCERQFTPFAGALIGKTAGESKENIGGCTIAAPRRTDLHTARLDEKRTWD